MSRNRIETCFLILALIWPTAAAWLYFVAASPDNPAVPIIYSASKVLQFALPVLCWVMTDRSRFRLTKFTDVEIGLGFAVGAPVFAAMMALYFGALKGTPLLSGLDVQVRLKLIAMGLDTKTKYVLFFLFLSFIHAGLEEYYWRSFVFAGLRKHLPLACAIAVSSLGFASHHVLVLNGFFPGRFWTAVVPLSFAIAIGGAVWAYQYHRSQSIYPSWVSHALVDLAIMLVGYDLIFQSS